MSTEQLAVKLSAALATAVSDIVMECSKAEEKQRKAPAQHQARKPIALCIVDAAQEVGMSERQFRRLFLSTRRLRSIPTGKRDRIVDYEELMAAYAAYVAEIRAQSTEQ